MEGLTGWAIVDEIGDLLPALVGELEEVADGDQGALQRAVSMIRRIRAWSALSASDDPVFESVCTREHLALMVESARGAVKACLEAMVAPVPLIAQDLAVAAQKSLNEAADSRLYLLRLRRDRESIMRQSSLDSLMTELLRVTLENAGVRDLLALEEMSTPRLQSVVDTRPAPGQAVDYRLNFELARLLWDERRLDSLVGKASAYLNAWPGFSRLVAGSVEFREDLEMATLEAFDASVQLLRSAQGGSVRRQVIRDAVALHASLMEGPGRLIAAVLLLAVGMKNRPCAKLKQENATDLIRAARLRDDLSDFFEGFSVELRNAESHKSWREHEGGVQIELRSHRSFISPAELVRRLSSTVLAMQAALLALRIASNAAGASSGSRVTLEALGLDLSQRVRLACSAFGATSLVSDVAGGVITLRGCFPSGRSRLTFSAFLVSIFRDEEIESVSFLDDCRSGHPAHVEVPSLKQRLFAAEVEEEAKEEAYAKLLRRVVVDGQVCLSDELLRKYVAIRAMPALTFDYAEAAKRLHGIRKSVEDEGDVLLVACLRDLARLKRHRDGGLPDDERSRRALENLTGWLRDARELSVP